MKLKSFCLGAIYSEVKFHWNELLPTTSVFSPGKLFWNQWNRSELYSVFFGEDLHILIIWTNVKNAKPSNNKKNTICIATQKYCTYLVQVLLTLPKKYSHWLRLAISGMPIIRIKFPRILGCLCSFVWCGIPKEYAKCYNMCVLT